MANNLILSNGSLNQSINNDVDINNNKSDEKSIENISILSKLKKIMLEQEIEEKRKLDSNEESKIEFKIEQQKIELENDLKDKILDCKHSDDLIKIENLNNELSKNLNLNEKDKLKRENIIENFEQNLNKTKVILNNEKKSNINSINNLNHSIKKFNKQNSFYEENIKNQKIDSKNGQTIIETKFEMVQISPSKEKNEKLDKKEKKKNDHVFNVNLDLNNNDQSTVDHNQDLKIVKDENNSKIKLSNNVKLSKTSQKINLQVANEQKYEPKINKVIQNSSLKGEIKDIELIIRASTIDGQRKGACLFCQEYFMDLYILAELNYIRLKISTVDLKKPPKDFRNNFDCTPPPILLDRKYNQQRAILENEKIERYIMKNIPGGHLLFIRDSQTAKLIENLYSKFKLALSRNEFHTKQNLLQQLEAINNHLADRKTKYLTGNYVCCFDCEFMTRLQHIRVAGAYFIKDFSIPSHFLYLWNYMSRMYSLNAFIQSCPADQDIISHYLNSNTILLNRNNMLKNKSHLELQTPCYSTSVLLPQNK